MRVNSRYTKGAGVKTNLYTKGGQFSDPTYQSANVYRGPYYTVHGVAYKGDKPPEKGKSGYGPMVRLIPITNNQDKFVYNNLKRRDYAKDWPGINATGPMITDKDEDRGWFMMYIAQYLPSDEFMEIDEEQYKLLMEAKSPHTKLYKSGFLKWRIGGYLFDKIVKGAIQDFGIVDTNRRSIGITEGTLPGLSNFLVDLTMYSNPDEEQGLFTDGTQLADEYGVSYEGDYHVQKDFGAMTGATHTGTPHKRLYPITDYIVPKAEEFRIKQTPQVSYNSIKG